MWHGGPCFSRFPAAKTSTVVRVDDADREVLKFIGDEGKTAEQVADRFPAFDVEGLVRAELVRPRRTTQSRRAPLAPDPRSTYSPLAEPGDRSRSAHAALGVVDSGGRVHVPYGHLAPASSASSKTKARRTRRQARTSRCSALSRRGLLLRRLAVQRWHRLCSINGTPPGRCVTSVLGDLVAAATAGAEVVRTASRAETA